MSIYSDAADRAGRSPDGTSDRELFGVSFSDNLIESWDQTFDFEGRTLERTITSGRSIMMPTIGRKSDAVDHVPGEEVYGGAGKHDEVEITLDKMTVDSVFIPEIDELMANYSLARPFAKQLGASLASVSNTRIGNSLILASRLAVASTPDGPLPSYYFNANIATDASKIEDGFFAGVQFIRENDVGGGEMIGYLPWAQQMLLSKYSGIDSEATSGSGDRANASTGLVAGIRPKGTNSVPRTNVTSGPTKYQGNFMTTYGVIANPMAVGRLMRRSKKIIIKTVEERLGTLIIASQLEGYGPLRGECSFELASATR